MYLSRYLCTYNSALPIMAYQNIADSDDDQCFFFIFVGIFGDLTVYTQVGISRYSFKGITLICSEE